MTTECVTKLRLLNHDFSAGSIPYEPPVGERVLIALNDVREVYGTRLVRFDQTQNTVTLEYDASRLTKSDREFMLRNAGIRLHLP